jgi:hypothetical protein
MRGVVRQCGITLRTPLIWENYNLFHRQQPGHFPSFRQKRGNESVDVGHAPRGRPCRKPQMWMDGYFCCTAIDTSILRTLWPSLPQRNLLTGHRQSTRRPSGGWVAGGQDVRIGRHGYGCRMDRSERMDAGPSVCLRRGYSVGRVKNFKSFQSRKSFRTN